MKRRNRYLRWTVELTHGLFPMLLVVYLVLLLVEAVFAGSISSYLNLDQLLIAVIVVGIIAILTAPHEAQKVKGGHLTRRGIFIIIGPGVIGAFIVWYKTKEIGWLSYVISVVSGVLIGLLSMLVWGGAGEEAEVRAKEEARKAWETADRTWEEAERKAWEAAARAWEEAERKARALREAEDIWGKAKEEVERLTKEQPRKEADEGKNSQGN
jgi:hypothetical protein